MCNVYNLWRALYCANESYPCSCFDGDSPVDLGKITLWERIELRVSFRITSAVDSRLTNAKQLLVTAFCVRAVEMPDICAGKNVPGINKTPVSCTYGQSAECCCRQSCKSFRQLACEAPVENRDRVGAR